MNRVIIVKNVMPAGKKADNQENTMMVLLKIGGKSDVLILSQVKVTNG